MAKASDNQFPYVHLVPAAAPANPSAGERLYLDSADGNKLKRRSTAGVVTVVEGGTPTAFGKDYQRVDVTSGNIALNATAITGISATDITLTAASGDLIEYGVSARIESEAQHVGFDVYTVVSSTLTNPFGPGLSATLSGAGGVPGWWTPAGIAQSLTLSGTITRTLVSGDISGGNVTLRLCYAKVNTSARTVNATSGVPLIVWAKNLGQLS